MKAKVKGIHSPDVFDLETFAPEDPDNFSFLLQVMVGPADREGEESFDIEVCTPNWISHNYKRDDVIICRHTIIVLEYNYERLLKRITGYVEKCEGNSWRDVAQKVGQLGKWEFDDYQA